MQFNEGARLDPSQMGGGGGGGKIAVGGGVGIIALIIALIFGIDPGVLMGGGQQAPQGQSTENPFAHCQSGADIAQDRDCRFVAYTNSVQDFWTQNLNGYQKGQTIVYNGAVDTACGSATSQVGPFYCPNDQKVYIDPSFFDDMLKNQLGARGGEAAEAYIFAHEYGHHVQNLTGIMEQVQSQGQTTGANSPAVKLELQADCFAGAWLAHATDDPESPISGLTQDDINRVVDAAQSVGDDRIQQRSQGQVQPDAWTHGSAAQRQKWTAIGFKSGDPNKCDTFGTSS